MSATQKKCDMKRKQHEATREKVQHEKSARVKYEKKVHKHSALDSVLGCSTRRTELYSGFKLSLFFSKFLFSID